MQLSSNNSLIQAWVGKNLPSEHIFIKDKNTDKSKLMGLYFRRWLLHPVRRKVARYYLMLLRNFFGLKVIGITGSAGKTTTKEMLKSILQRQESTVASIKNIDPIYNIPQTILKCRPNTKYLVLEMGVEYPGEMDFYVWLAQPDVSVITNIFPTHTEFFGSREGVYKEKVKIIKYLKNNDHAVLNHEDDLLRLAGKNTKANILFFGKGTKTSASDIVYSEEGTIYTLSIGESKISVQIPIIGRQFVNNALAAVAVAKIFGIKKENIKKGLLKFEQPPNRMNTFYTKKGALIIDDSYNNNPEAAIEVLRVFEKVAKSRKKIIVFGDMLELGDLKVKYHQKLGKMLSGYNLELLVGVGEASRELIKTAKSKMDKEKCVWVNDRSGVYDIIVGRLQRDTAVLIKGSRSLQLDKVADKLKEI